MVAENEFGGQHTELKLSVVEKYLKAFCTALRPHFKELMYVDACAGTGSRTVKVEARDGDLFESPVAESVEQRRGSAQIAIDVASPGFDLLVFMERKASHVAVAAASGAASVRVWQITSGTFGFRQIPVGGPAATRPATAAAAC